MQQADILILIVYYTLVLEKLSAVATNISMIKESPNPKAKIFFILYFPLYISFFHLQLLYKLYILIIRYEYKFPCIYRIIISPSLSYGYNERQGPA